MIYWEKAKEYLSLFLTQAQKYINKDTFAKVEKWLKSVSWKSPKAIGALALALVIVCGGIFYLSTTTSAVGIVVNGKTIGYAPNMTEAKQFVQAILSKHGEVAGTVAQTSDQIEYDRVRVSKEKFAASAISTEVLAGSITPFIQGYGLQVGEKIAVVMANEQDIDAVLAKYKDYFAKPSDKNSVSSAEIVESFTKVPIKANPSDVKNVDQALDILVKGDVAEKKYTVQQNDTLWAIARKNDMWVEELLAGNKGLTEDSVIQPGQEIKIVKTQPYLTVIAKGTKVVDEVIPFDVVTNTDSKLATGKSVVKQEGKDGEKIVTYNYVEKNGSIVDKQVVKEEVVTQPVKQIIAKGPARAPVYVGTSRGSGSVSGLIWPISGSITSYYGYRHGGFHTGLDIDGVTGQPYTAAAAGKVTFAGWDGGYGYCIIIDHGNGVATRYGHSSKLLVHVGDTVSRGQTIGLVGSTGRSTGSHLHFEVIINGSTVNPLSYL
ncbi:MAG: peptidoglycan DD-metalloendopeptidase family protein [Peptococcaceae bacterium]|nr:peptidoglycan DD-metalloendopeptidase family protein [Peptococcaceae bacterium]